ncbi:MAG: hypothetical protein QXV69_05060 [Sulfolobaceae archaeon]
MNKRVSVEVTDVKVFKSFLRLIEEYNLKWILDKIDIVTNYGQIKLNNNNELKSKLGKILSLIFGKEYFNELLVGIDVNTLSDIILVVMADGNIVLIQKTNFEKILDKIKDIIDLFNYKKLKIGVGNGNIYGDIVYKLIKEKYGDNVKLVDEKRTSSFNPYITIKDEDIRAAVKIALSAML